MVGFIENTAMRHRRGGGREERRVGFIENTAMRHRRGGWVKGSDDDVYHYTRWRLSSVMM